MRTMIDKSWIGASTGDLPTPCLIVDRDALERNIAALSAFLRRSGKALRAHAKTHKCTRLAQMQVEHGASGICAAKLSEAEVLLRAGLRNILITGPVVGLRKHNRLMDCLCQDSGLLVAIDDFENARQLSAAAGRRGLTLSCLVDIDVGLQRTGVPPVAAADLAESLAALPNLAVRGIQAYGGHAQHIIGFEERRAAVRRSLDAACESLAECRRRLGELPILSVGGTGSVQFDMEYAEVTEVQAGSYVFMDAEYLPLEWGSFLDQPGTFETSLHLLSTVVSMGQKDFVTIDAGLKSVYRDGAIPLVAAPEHSTYDWFGDEYGKLTPPPGAQVSLGDKVKLVVSHCDPTINLHDVLVLVHEDTVTDVWRVDLRGCSE